MLEYLKPEDRKIVSILIFIVIFQNIIARYQEPALKGEIVGNFNYERIVEVNDR